MASPIALACPQCQKQYKVPPEMEGKRIRCKACGHAFPVPAAEKPKPAPAPVVPDEDEDANSNPYKISDETELTLRCPHCAEELPDKNAVICMNCGYNLKTRQKIQVKKVIATTSSDRLAWLAPGFVCILVIIVLAVLDFLFVTWQPDERRDYAWLASGGFKVWAVVISLAFMFFAGKFAFKRLILEPTPPEREAR